MFSRKLDTVGGLRPFLPLSPCVLCGDPAAPSAPLCAPCLGDLPRVEQACVQCGDKLSAGGLRCGRCLQSSPSFDATTCALRYAPPLDWLLTRFRDHARFDVGDWLAAELAQAVADQPRPDYLIPVPARPESLRTRGFNQAGYLARGVGRSLGIPVWHDVLRRSAGSAAQHELGYRERLTNLREAFAVERLAPASCVAVIDDVMTTGATAEVIARLLKQHGVQRVVVWAACRRQRN